MKRNYRKNPLPQNIKLRRRIAIRRESGLSQKASAAAIRRAVRRTLEHQSFNDACSLSILLAGEDTLAELNTRYRGVAHATDVLSFSARMINPETSLLHLGDIAVSLPRAARQAAARRTTLESEILLLAVHGTLHLLGHDHEKPVEQKRMWKAQREILKELI